MWLDAHQTGPNTAALSVFLDVIVHRQLFLNSSTDKRAIFYLRLACMALSDFLRSNNEFLSVWVFYKYLFISAVRDSWLYSQCSNHLKCDFERLRGKKT